MQNRKKTFFFEVPNHEDLDLDNKEDFEYLKLHHQKMIVIPKKGYKLNFACILTTGRTGSDFLQGCLDGIPGIITFSGEIPFYKFINDPNTKKILKIIIIIKNFTFLLKNITIYFTKII